MIYTINKQLLLESVSLLEEEMSPIAKRGLQIGGVGAGLAMGHAGAFGGGIKGAIDSGAEMGANMGNRAAAIAGNSMNTTKDFYAPKTGPDSHPGQANDAVQAANESAKHASADAASDTSDDGDDDDDSGLGVLGTIGAGTLAAGAGYLGLKGGKAGNKAYQGSNLQKGIHNSAKNTAGSYKAGKAGMAQAGGSNIANRLGGVRRALGGR